MQQTYVFCTAEEAVVRAARWEHFLRWSSTAPGICVLRALATDPAARWVAVRTLRPPQLGMKPVTEIAKVALYAHVSTRDGRQDRAGYYANDSKTLISYTGPNLTSRMMHGPARSRTTRATNYLYALGSGVGRSALS